MGAEIHKGALTQTCLRAPGQTSEPEKKGRESITMRQKSTIRVGGPYFENVAGFCDRLARETVRKKARSSIWREKKPGTTDDAG